MKKAIRILAVAIALFMLSTTLLAACEPDDPIDDSVKVVISRPEANIEVGEELSLSAVASDGSAVTWSSSNTAVATVSETGVVLGVAVGAATITATAGEALATCSVTVRAVGHKVDKLPKTYVSDGKDYTMNDYLTVTPSNWNELDYTDNNDTAIMGYIGSPFFEYDYKFDGGKFKSDGSINFDGIVENDFEVKYSAATALEDVTAQYGSEWGLTSEQIAAGGYIWKITLRHDLAWNDGTPIYAEDFVYTMQQQLDPQFQLSRADTWYNNAVKIHNAKTYFYQGRGAEYKIITALNHSVKEIDAEGKIDGTTIYLNVVDYWGVNADSLVGNPNCVQGKYMPISDDETKLDDSYIKEDGTPVPSSEMTTKEVYENFLQTYGGLEQADKYIDAFAEKNGIDVLVMATGVIYPETFDFSDVGIFSVDDYDIVLVLDQPQQYIKEDGSLSYLAAYNFGSLPLVKKDLYEACKRAPQSGSTLWTTTYNTSLDTTASWGPYMLTQFQAGRQFTLGRNEYWYGYALDEYKGQYLTDQIVTQVIATEAASQLAFWAGEIDSLGLSVSIADDYKNSDYAIYTPGSGTFGIQLYGNLPVLKNSGRNNGILAIKEFRGALSLALDRVDYNTKMYAAHRPNLGVVGPAYYYDVENALTYRESEAGKQSLLLSYGFTFENGQWTDGTDNYADIDEAYDAMTGYNLAKAKEWLEAAYKELTTNADTYGYDPSKKIEFIFGTSTDNESTRRQFNYFVDWLKTLTDGTSLEGNIELTFDSSFGDDWADAFKNGEYEFAAGIGVTGAIFDPFFLIGAYVDPADSINYHIYWDTAKETLTLTLPAGNYEGAGQEHTLSILQWYNNLNGNTTAGANFTCNWGVSSGTPVEVRLQILAALEQCVLSHYYFVPTTSQYSAALHSAKWNYASDTYNVMMTFGGIQYMQYNFTDSEWAAFVKEHKNDLSEFYKTSTAA